MMAFLLAVFGRITMTETSIMPEGMEDFEDLFLAFIEAENKKEAKIKDIYDKIFGKMSMTDKLNKFIEIKPWITIITDYFKANKELMNGLNFTEVSGLGSYMDDSFIKELNDNFDFIDLNFDKLDLSDEDINLWSDSQMFWFTTGLWIVAIDSTDYIVHKMSGQGETHYFINTVDEFIVNDPNAKVNLSEYELDKFAKQFKEFALKCKN